MNHGLRTEAQPGLRIRVFDALRDAAADGLRVEVFRLGQDAEKRCSGRIGSDGALVDPDLHGGEYEVVVHLGEYYRGFADGRARDSFLESVTLRLCIADPQRSCELPLRITPAGICMGSA
jgi:5-hydroxyisourate hydrolase-like protein (transthyretin family)